ncbi:DUF4350 domain-containing protein [Amycolatopsis sp.]|uniref:DUF4350 domain-containing protein n=1 Tax=Amycolatopsis sp. TaxID=37632 RepID=UPI002DFD48A0|nr:DUF4350 domain-containing protein [Amycolatopsis sp.]
MTSISPDARRIWHGLRVPFAILALIVVTALVIVLSRGDQTFGVLEPGSYEPTGSRAVAELLRGQGVQLEVVRTAAEARRVASGATVLVTNPDLVLPDRLEDLRTQAKDLVLVAPTQKSLDLVLPGARSEVTIGLDVRSPDCTNAAAVAAGDARVGGITYRTTITGARSCYAGALVHVSTSDDRSVTLLGDSLPLTNQYLDEDGNAALSLRLLGENPRLVWYLPSAADPALDTAKVSFYDLIPDGWRFGAIQLAVAAALFALWRARRLGPVVTEPLPVVVRAAETVEGRARLYRKAGAADHAGTILREATCARLRPTLGLTVDAEPAAIVETVAVRSGRDAERVGALLFGPPPADDPALVRLANELDVLEKEVGQS